MKKSVSWATVVAMVAAGSSLFVMATRPCEPRAEAAENPAPVVVEHEISVVRPVWVGSPKISSQASRKPLAHPSRKHGECSAYTPGVVVSEQELIQGSGGTVVVYDCQ